jgi:hypothetical protein
MVSNRTPYPPPTHTLYKYTAYLFIQGGGEGVEGVELEIRGEGQQGRVQITNNY